MSNLLCKSDCPARILKRSRFDLVNDLYAYTLTEKLVERKFAGEINRKGKNELFKN